MKLLHRITLALLVSTLIPLSGSATNAASQPVSHLLAQQSDEAALQEAARLNEQAVELYQQGRYAEAEPLYQRSLQIRERALGETHPDVATSLNNLAELYKDQGNYAEAEPLYQRALQIFEQSLGNAHPFVATTLNNLALLYQVQGNYAEAEPLFQRALQIREQALGDAHPEVADILNNLAMIYLAEGNYTEAEPLYRRALQICEQALCDGYPDIAITLISLATLYEVQGNYAEAEHFYRRTVQILEQALGDNHPDIAPTLEMWAALYTDQGNYAEAEPLFQRVVQINEQALGDAHPEVADSLNGLAAVYMNQGNYAEAEPLYQRVLQIREQALGDAHPEVADSLNSLAMIYEARGSYAGAEPLFQRALEIRERNFGEVHPDVSVSLHNLATIYNAQGNYAEAEPLFRRALQISEQSLGETPLLVAANLNNLATLYLHQGNYAEAEPLLQRALQIREQSLGEVHPSVATSLVNLAEVYKAQGNYAEAEPLLQRALQIFEQSLGETHPDVAASLNNLATQYLHQGNYAEAEPLLQRALQISEQSLGGIHPSVATSLVNLAEVYKAQGNYAEAERLLQRALRIDEQSVGETHPSVATSLNNLASLYRDQGNYAEAESLYQRALQISEQSLGDTHPSTATNLYNLAETYKVQGDYAEAEPLYQRAVQIFEQSSGDNHPYVAISLLGLASLYRDQGNFEKMLPLLNRSLSIEEVNLSDMFSIGSDTRKKLYATTLQGSTFHILSLSQQLPQFSQLSYLAFETVIRRKGRVLDAVADSNQRLRGNFSNQDKLLFDQLQTRQAQLASLLFKPPAQIDTNRYRTEVASLKQQINEIENTLAQRSAEFRVEVEPVTIEAVQAQLPQDAALVELVQYEPYDSEINTWQPPRYAAYVLTAQGDVKTVDLGEATVIDQKIAELRQALLEPHLQVKPIARQLDALLMQPIRAQLGDAAHLLISPDGQLNLLPFAVLVDENDKYLIETYQITYLTSGRDLLRLRLSEPSQEPAIIMGDPNYNQADTVATPDPPSTQANQRSSNANNLAFTKLPGTAEEANAIATLIPNATLLLKEDATENALKQVQSPSILHLATHGFFLQNLPLVPLPDLQTTRSFGETSLPVGPQENPLLRAGLAFAGANQRQSGNQDGILTALEASGLDLRGTQLVVLSACETGVGEIANGEGVYGLRRSLVIAGAQSQLVSLWLVSDTGTKDLMIDYYERLLSGQGRSEALRQTQLAMLNGEKYQHPYYWAAFISSGDWSPLNMN